MTSDEAYGESVVAHRFNMVTSEETFGERVVAHTRVQILKKEEVQILSQESSYCTVWQSRLLILVFPPRRQDTWKTK